MNLFNKFFRTKAAPQPVVSQSIIVNNMPRVEAQDRDFISLVKDGYRKNVVAKRCVDLVSDSVASLPYALFQVKGGEKVRIYDHPLLDLLKKPNPMQGQQEFFKEAAGNLMIGGNSYMNAVKPFDSKPPAELFNLPPSQMTVISGNGILPLSYEYKLANASKIRFDIDQLTGESLVLHTKTYNPLNKWYGQSPLEAAAPEVDQYNEMNIWNYSLLKNGARPSVAITVNNGGTNMALTPQQRATLKEDIDRALAGAKNTGRPILLENGMDIKEMQLSPKEMDFLGNKNVTTKDIGNAYGVPGQMLGVEGSQTFANYEQARESFYIETVLPVAKLFLTDMNGWLTVMFGDNLVLEVDESKVPALETTRLKRYKELNPITYLTINEKRELVGFGKYEATGDPADTILVNGSMFPLEFVADENLQDENQDSKELRTKDGSSSFTYLEGKQFDLTTDKQKRALWFEFNRKKIKFERRFAAQVAGFFAKQSNDIANALINVSPDLINFVVDTVIDDSTNDLTNIFKKNNAAAYASFGEDVLNFKKHSPEKISTKEDPDDAFLREVLNYTDNEAAQNVGNIQGTTRKAIAGQIKEGLSEGESTPQISKRIEGSAGFSSARSMRIARTEIQGASNKGSRSAARKLNMPQLEKEWISATDERVRDGSPETTDHKSMNGVKVLMDSDFEVWSKDGTDFMDGPGDSKAPVDQLVNCRCTQVYVTRSK